MSCPARGGGAGEEAAYFVHYTTYRVGVGPVAGCLHSITKIDACPADDEQQGRRKEGSHLLEISIFLFPPLAAPPLAEDIFLAADMRFSIVLNQW